MVKSKAVFFTMTILIIAFGCGENKSSEPTKNEPHKAYTESTEKINEQGKKEKDPFHNMSPAEHLRIVKEELSKYDLSGNMELAKSHLSAIPPESVEYKQVKELQSKICAKEKEIDKYLKNTAQEVAKLA